MARYSFSGSVPPKFEHKLRRHKQRFGKIVIATKNCNSNEMTLLPILLAAVILGTGNCSFKIVYGSLFLQKPPRCSWSLSGICKNVIEIFWDEVFIVRNTVKNGQSWCSTVICRKPGAFDMQFHLTVDLIFLKTCVKDHGDSSSRLLERRIWLVCIEALLLSVCKHFGVL